MDWRNLATGGLMDDGDVVPRDGGKRQKKMFNVKSALFGNLRDFGSAMFPRAELMGATEENEDDHFNPPMRTGMDSNRTSSGGVGVTEIELARSPGGASAQASSGMGASAASVPTNEFRNPFAPTATVSGSYAVNQNAHDSRRQFENAGTATAAAATQGPGRGGGGGGDDNWADFSSVEFGGADNNGDDDASMTLT
jgi:hypothetical protein